MDVTATTLDCPDPSRPYEYYGNHNCVVNDLGEVFYDQMRAKLKEFDFNFVPAQKENRRKDLVKKSYSISGGDSCRKDMPEGVLTNVSEIKIKTRKIKKGYKQTVSYMGCDEDKPLFVEVHKIHGDNVKAHPINDLLKGKKRWHLQLGEELIEYKLTHAKKGQLIKITSTYKRSKQITKFYLRHNLLLKLITPNTISRTRAVFAKYAYEFSAHIDKSMFSSSDNAFKKISLLKDGEISYFKESASTQPLSPSQFEEIYNQNYREALRNTYGSIMKALISEFPKTKSESVGNVKTRFERKFDEARKLVLSGKSDDRKVLNFFRNTRKAMDEELLTIEDKRPDD